MLEGLSYPVFLNLAGRHVLIVGGGAVGARKARGLAASAAMVTVISPEISQDIVAMGDVECIMGRYESGQMAAKNWRLLFAATNDGAVNQQVQRDAASAGIWCCRCDEPEEGDFFGGATERVGGVTLAVSTGGASPVMAKRIVEQAAHAIDPVIGKLALASAWWRSRIKQEIREAPLRSELLKRLGGPEMEECFRSKGATEADQLISRWLADAHAGEQGATRVD